MATESSPYDTERLSVALAEVEARRLELEDKYRWARSRASRSQMRETTHHEEQPTSDSYLHSSSPSSSPTRRVQFSESSLLDGTQRPTRAVAAEFLQGVRGEAGTRPSLTSRTSSSAGQGDLVAVLNAMREDRQQSEDRFTSLMERLFTERQHDSGINKAIPQVQPMKDREDLYEYFQLFEQTQGARRTPREAWAATLLPLLNSTCKSLALSLPANVRSSYTHLKAELIAQADSRTDDTIQVFWEHKKLTKSTWREELAELTKLARRCTVGLNAEEVRQVFIMEQLTQQLPRSIQQYVRERKPTDPNSLLNHITTYFRAHGLSETEWEHRDKDYGHKKTGSRQTSYQHHSSGYTTPRASDQRTTTAESHQTSGSQQGKSSPPNQSSPNDTTQTHTQRSKRDMTKVQCHNCKQYGHYAWQCVKVNVVTLPEFQQQKEPPVMKRGRIGENEHPWYMDSGADMCFIAEDLLPENHTVCAPVHAKGAMHPDGRVCATVRFDAAIDGKRTKMLAAVAPRSMLPYPAIVGRNGSGLNIQWNVEVTKAEEKESPVEKIEEAEEPSRQELEVKALDSTPLTQTADTDRHKLPQDLDTSSDADILAIQTRAQKRRQQLQQQQDAADTAQSGAVIHPLESHKETTEGVDSTTVHNPMDRPDEEQDDMEADTVSQPGDTVQEEEDVEMDGGIQTIITDPFTRKDLVEQQKKDGSLQALFDAAKEEESDYVVSDDILYAIQKEPKGDDNPYKIVVPSTLRQRILDLGHDRTGHFGHKKTRKHIQAHFYWPGIAKDIRRHCQNCHKCMAFNNHRKDVQPQQIVPIVTTPWKKIAMDVVGPLTQTKSGCRYILTVIDLATRYPVAIPLRKVDVQTTCDALIEIFASYGVPEEVVSDNGGNFTAQLMKEVLLTLGIHQIRTSPYHPEANGAVERFNGTLKKALKKAGSKASTWDKWLPYVLYTVRVTPHEATGYSPFELLFGRQPDTPISSLRNALEDPAEDLPKAVDVYLKDMQAKMKIAQEAAGKQDRKSKQSSKSYQDNRKKAEESSLQPGDYVLCLEPKKKRGLSAKWQGPYQILKKLGRLTYLLDTGQNKTKKRHRNALKVYLPEQVDVCSLISAIADEDAMDTILLEPHIHPVGEKETIDWNSLPGLSHLSEEKKQQLITLLKTYQDVFDDVPGPAKFPPYHLDTGNHPPVSHPPYRPSLMWKDKVKEAVDKLLEAGFVRPSTSPWSSPVLPVPKPDGSIRLVVDYRAVNKLTQVDRYPLPRIDELLAHVGKATYLTTLDLSQGYHQVELSEDSIPKTAFITTFGKFEYVRMPFGLVNAPAYFQRLMDESLQDKPAEAYLDDIAIADQEWKQHLINLEEILQMCRDKNISLKLKKCHFGNAKLDYLGHQVGSGEILPQEVKIEAILKFPQPETRKQLQSFLGLVGYYRSHIPGFSTRSAALSDLTKKGKPDLIKWTEDLQKTFHDVRSSILEAPILTTPDTALPYHLFTDASGVGLGAVLKQQQAGEMKTIGFYSYKLKEAERNYSVIELETYAIIKACLHFAAYLRGTTFTVHTDHRALKFLQTMKNSSVRLMRWAMILQPYSYQVVHLPGHLNVEADALSRTWDNQLPSSGPFKRGGMLDAWLLRDGAQTTEPDSRTF